MTRATDGVVVAFAVADWAEFQAIWAALLSSGRFEPQPSVKHRLHHRGHLPVDLIPFGGVERADRTVAWPPPGDEVMTVLGYREAKSGAMEARLPSGRRIRVPSLSMLALLKLFAWSERHTTAPRKDAADLEIILRNYLDAGQAERIYDEAAHLLDAEDFDHERAGTWLLGHDAYLEESLC